MCKISYEKCVCFLFLVILAVLSCSGFRIDSLAMTDISKRNSYTSSSLLKSDEFFDRLFNADAAATTSSPYRHRIRHHRQLRAQARHPRPVDAAAAAASAPPAATLPSGLLPAQIPSTDVRPLAPTRPVVARSQRSNDQRGPRNRKHLCQEQDAPWKAYMANTVIIAKAESMSSNRRENYTVYFKVLHRIKNSSFPVDDYVPLKFSSDKNSVSCDGDLAARSAVLGRHKIEKSKEYVLFLNAYDAHNYSLVGAPEPRKRKILHSVEKVLSPSFKPRPAKVEKLERVDVRNKRLKLLCKVKGFPIPSILWKHNNNYLHSNSHVRITYKSDGKDRRKSTLVIRSPTEGDWGRYECIAHGVDDSRALKQLRVERRPASTHTSTSIPSEKTGAPCEEKMKNDFCLNGGTCFYLRDIGEYGCECANGFIGKQCQEKSSDQSSEHDDSI